LFNHKSVFKNELFTLVEPIDSSSEPIIVDCTAGGGGHLEVFLKHIPSALVIAIDRDKEAIDHLEQCYGSYIKEGRLILVQRSFGEITNILYELEYPLVDLIYADFGVSSPQIDNKERGFSFQYDGPLDMRMDKCQSLTAKDIIMQSSYEDLCEIFYKFGEEPNSKRIARKILSERQKSPITTTFDLVRIVESVAPRSGKKHPATKIFQALRIATNGELSAIEALLENGYKHIAPKGQMAFISFHSLEDRLVKTFIKSKQNTMPELLRRLPTTQSFKQSILVHKAIKPSEHDIAENPRCRSAHLRGFKKIE
jgi:16S rRNA (cytosine1402-N4)-methyltransferase